MASQDLARPDATGPRTRQPSATERARTHRTAQKAWAEAAAQQRRNAEHHEAEEANTQDNQQAEAHRRCAEQAREQARGYDKGAEGHARLAAAAERAAANETARR